MASSSRAGADDADIREEVALPDASLLRTNNFSGATIKCGNREWKVHKSILCTRSVWFQKALCGFFKEATTGVVEIKNFTPEQVDWVVTFICTGTIDIEKASESGPVYGICVRLWAVADYFCLQPLMNHALRSLLQHANSQLPLLNRTVPHPELNKMVEDLMCGIEAAWVTYPHAKFSQQLLVRLVCASRFTLFNCPEFNTLFREIPEFSADLLCKLTGGWTTNKQTDFVVTGLVRCDACAGVILGNDSEAMRGGGPRRRGQIPTRCGRCIRELGYFWGSEYFKVSDKLMENYWSPM